MKRSILALLLFAATTVAQAAASYTFTVTATLNFPSANPNTTSSISGTAPVVAQIVIVDPQRENFRIMVQANGANLTSGTDTIAVGNITWTATAAFTTACPSAPPPCNVQNAASITATAGTQTLTTSVVNSATGNDGRQNTTTDTYTGTVTHNFFLANSWFYTTGSYTQSLLFTFASP
jgi:hypothetical protein